MLDFKAYHSRSYKTQLRIFVPIFHPTEYLHYIFLQFDLVLKKIKENNCRYCDWHYVLRILYSTMGYVGVIFVTMVTIITIEIVLFVLFLKVSKNRRISHIQKYFVSFI